MNECDETEACECNACLKARADFDAWADAFEARWAKAEAEGKVARLPKQAATAPSGLLERAL